MTTDDEILIAGAGIGGLALALSLHAHGFAVRVFEAVPEIRPLGVGINMLPHAVRELTEMGLREALDHAGVHCRELAYYNRHGQRIWAEPRGLAAGYHWPQISIHRGVLQMILLEAARERIGDDRIRLGQPLVGYEAEPGEGVRVRFDPACGAPDAAGRVLVAADGIHSTVRHLLYPGEGGPSWNGAVMWRGVAECEAFLDGHTMIMAGHPRTKFVAYPIRHARGAGGTGLVNFIAERRFDTTELTEREDWSKPGDLADFLPEFEAWRFDWLDVPALVQAASQVFVYPMVDRDPLPRWTHGPVTLLGDAAHPMYPIGSNGASQAILDARVLTGCLRGHPSDPERALARYDDIRREATAKIVLANRGQGPELPMQLVEERAPDGFARLEDVISADELRGIADGYKKVAGFAVQELNERGPLVEPTL